MACPAGREVDAVCEIAGTEGAKWIVIGLEDVFSFRQSLDGQDFLVQDGGDVQNFVGLQIFRKQGEGQGLRGGVIAAERTRNRSSSGDTCPLRG